jgi:heme-degrading monooxygenase HmoA
MYLRANEVSVDRDRVDDLIRFVESDVLPAIREQSGARGLAMGVDRDAGQCAIVSFWDDLDQLRASDANVARMRDTAAERFGATFDIRVAELVERRIVEQPGPGCWNRVSMLDVAESDMDAAIETFRISTLPALEAIPGFCAAMLTLDREQGRMTAVTTWRDHDALTDSRERADRLRAEVRDKAHGEIVRVFEREVVVSEMFH